MRVPFGDDKLLIEEATPHSFQGVDLSFFSAGASVARELVPVALAQGAVVVDNSSAFRMEANVPLVVPEINAAAMQGRLFPVANCTAIVLCMAIAPLRSLGRIERLIVSTYQAASGGGAALLEDLFDQTRQSLAGDPVTPSVSPHPYAFNLFSHNTPVGDDGLNGEEAKVIAETRKILDQPDLKINVTCVRVPIPRAHTLTITAEFVGFAPTEDAVRAAIEAFPGLCLVDDRSSNRFPMPAEATGRDEVLVGRIRRDPSHSSAIQLMACGDQLRKGAALNGVQIARKLGLL